jgi:WD40 repeat protein
MQQFELGEDAVVALIDRDQQVWVWDIATEQVRIQLPRPIADDKTAVPGQAEQVGSVQLALNHHSIVTTVNQPDPNSGRYGATLWAGSTGALIGQLTGHRQPISALQFSPDGTYVVTASQDGAVRLWAATPGSELPAFRTDQTLPLTFLPNQTLLPTQTLPAQPIATPTSEITSSLPSEARVAQSKELTAAIQTSPRSVVDSLPAQLPARHLPTQNSVSWMARLSRLGAWKPWQAARNSPASIPSASPTAPGSVASIATQLIGIDPQGQLQRWQIRTDPPTLPQMAQAGFSGSHAVAVPIDQRSDQENTWREKLGWFMHRTMASPRLIKTGFAQLPNQLPSRLLSQFADHPSNSSSDQLSRSLNVRETVLSVGSASTASDAIDSTAITSKALSADGRWLATADLQGRISLYQIQSDRSLRRVYQLQNWRSNASLPENAARSVSQVIQSSQPETSQGDPIAIRQLVFSPDGQQLLGIADDLTLRTWYTATGDLNQVFRGHGATIRQARFSADGQWVISASWDRTARIWQAATGRMIQILAHADAVSSVDLNADGRAITASWNGTAQIWQVKTGKPLARLQGHQREILDLRFSPDGQRVVTASADGTARLWNAESGAEEAVLTPPQVTSLPKDVTLETAEADQSGQPIAAIEQATFSPDGQYVATVTATGQVNLWAATPEMLLKLAADRTVRQLTPEECQRYLRLPTDQCPQLP